MDQLQMYITKIVVAFMLCLFVGSGARVDGAGCASRSSVAWVVDAESIAPPEHFTDRVSSSIGPDANLKSVKPVIFTDRHAFGANETSQAWLFTYEVVLKKPATADTELVLQLSVVIDRPSGQIVVAFCEGDESSDIPPQSPEDLESLATKNGWEWRGLEAEDVKASPAQVLAVLWKQLNIAPTGPAMIVLRPRFVRNSYPSRVVDGEQKPLLEPQVMWIVEVRGGKVMTRTQPDGTEVALTGLLGQVTDKDLTFVRGITMP